MQISSYTSINKVQNTMIQLTSWVDQDFLTLTYPPNINFVLEIHFWYPHVGLFDAIINVIIHAHAFTYTWPISVKVGSHGIPSPKPRVTWGQSVQSQMLRAWKLGLTTSYMVPNPKSQVWHGCPHGKSFWRRGLGLVLRVGLRARSHMASHYTRGSMTTHYMILEVSWDGIWTLSFGFSQFHGHGSWFMCEVALTETPPNL